MNNQKLPVAIIGGGPVGLAAAAHLAKRKIPFFLLEAGKSVGENLLSWSHVRVFSPWQYNIDKAAVELLQQTDWKSPDPEGLPTGKQLVLDYLRPLAEHPLIKENLHLNSKVLAVGRLGLDKMKTAGRDQQPFRLKVEEDGKIKYYKASAILDASGTWNQPNPIGSGGVMAEGEEELAEHIVYGIPDVKGADVNRYKNKNVLVVGSGHSAVNVLLELAEVQSLFPQTQLNWVLRKKDIQTVYGGQEEDALAARGALGVAIEKLVSSGNLKVFTPFYIERLNQNENGIQIAGRRGTAFDNEVLETIPNIDEIISNTGSRPNLDMIREIRTDIDASLESVQELAELIDPNIHSCGTVRAHGEKELRHQEKDFYIIGSKSYGRAPTFLMATGYEQVRSVVAFLAGDLEAALKVELDLPETGVCSSGLENSSCCATAPESVEEKSAVCCEQPTDGTACCDKTASKEENVLNTNCC